MLFAAAAMVLGVLEFSRALQVAGRRVDVVPQLVMGFLLVLSGFFLGAWVHWVATLVAVAAAPLAIPLKSPGNIFRCFIVSTRPSKSAAGSLPSTNNSSA